jgi:hypothetical protein
MPVTFMRHVNVPQPVPEQMPGPQIPGTTYSIQVPPVNQPPGLVKTVNGYNMVFAPNNNGQIQGGYTVQQAAGDSAAPQPGTATTGPFMLQVPGSSSASSDSSPFVLPSSSSSSSSGSIVEQPESESDNSEAQAAPFVLPASSTSTTTIPVVQQQQQQSGQIPFMFQAPASVQQSTATAPFMLQVPTATQQQTGQTPFMFQAPTYAQQSTATSPVQYVVQNSATSGTPSGGPVYYVVQQSAPYTATMTTQGDQQSSMDLLQPPPEAVRQASVAASQVCICMPYIYI